MKGGYVRRTITSAEAARMPTAKRHGNGWSLPRSHYVWNLVNLEDVVELGEVVHHVNRVRDDDRAENLQKMTRRAHEDLHIEARGRTTHRPPLT